jgi:hypothetical protein
MEWTSELRCNICNDCFALHNSLEAMDNMNMPTRGLHHFVTRKSPRGASQRAPRALETSGGGDYFLSPPLPPPLSSPPLPMDS